MTQFAMDNAINPSFLLEMKNEVLKITLKGFNGRQANPEIKQGFIDKIKVKRFQSTRNTAEPST